MSTFFSDGYFTLLTLKAVHSAYRHTNYYKIIMRGWSSSIRQHGTLKRWYPTSILHGGHNPEDLDSNIINRRENLKNLKLYIYIYIVKLMALREIRWEGVD
jgi:hypothetical protein